MRKIDILCRKLFNPTHVVVATRTDAFWQAPNVDFVRIRQMTESPSGHGQMTVKKCDKGDNFDRLEIDVNVDNVAQAIRLKTAETGRKPCTVRKRYSVLFLDKSDTNISIYQVQGSKHVFIEVESRSSKKVKALVSSLHELIPYPLERVPYSLYDMFVLRKGGFA
jgi:hypothetical protein